MTAPHFDTEHVTVWHGDCIDVMRNLEPASVDAVVCDPPYGLEFMGADWDSFGKGGGAVIRDPATERGGFQDGNGGNPYSRSRIEYGRATRGSMHAFQAWCEEWAREAYRLLKPGGHLLAFGGTRTHHRLASGIEDAGFEIRDSIAWLYGQGFPKSADPGCRCQPIAFRSDPEPETQHGLPGVQHADVPAAVPVGSGTGPVLLPRLPQPGAPALRTLPSERAPRSEEPGLEGRRDSTTPEGQLPARADGALPAGTRLDAALERTDPAASPRDGAANRPTADTLGMREPRQPRPAGQPSGEPRALPDEPGSQARGGREACPRCGKPLAKGLGSALKPSFEPVVVARKPLTGTLSANVLAYGTGALNIDASRIGTSDPLNGGRYADLPDGSTYNSGINKRSRAEFVQPSGRWPANVVLDASQATALDAQAGTRRSAGNYPSDATTAGLFGDRKQGQLYDDQGGASRFFKTVDDVAPRFMYTAKAGSSERPKVARDGEGDARTMFGNATSKTRVCRVCGNRTNGNPAGTWPACSHDDWEWAAILPKQDSADMVSHPTVKPVDLMRWLVRLVTPKGGTVLEPFAGSGTTVEAAVLEGFRCIAIEREADYLPLIMQRVSKPHAVGLDFGDWDYVS